MEITKIATINKISYFDARKQLLNNDNNKESLEKPEQWNFPALPSTESRATARLKELQNPASDVNIISNLKTQNDLLTKTINEIIKILGPNNPLISNIIETTKAINLISTQPTNCIPQISNNKPETQISFNPQYTSIAATTSSPIPQTLNYGRSQNSTN